jgi:phage-related minor tail protein
MADIFNLSGDISVNIQELLQGLRQADEAVERTGESINKAGEHSKLFSASMTAVGTATAAASGFIIGGVKSVDDYQKALNDLSAKTGAGAEEQKQFGDVIKSVYGDNFGKSFEDVGQAVANVNQNLGLTGDELKKVTEYAVGYGDTFDVDINESTRAAEGMMQNFGVTAEEAYNLMTQGAQNGLDKNGELLDSVNEYSVQFNKVGLGAEDMFNIFQAGADSGAFSIDKIGDSVKEFSIRAVDGSKTTQDGFKSLGLDADATAAKFAQGGDSAKQSFQEVITALAGVKDPLEQNRIGVELFGTQWEDLGPKAITQLANIQGAYDKTNQSAQKLNEIKYNSFGEAITGIGRQIQTGILLPLGEAALPMLNKFSTWFAQEGVPKIKQFADTIQAHMPQIEAVVTTVFNVLMTGFTFIVNNINTIVPLIGVFGAAFAAIKIATTIQAAVTAFNTFRTALMAGQTAMAAFNLVCSANPISLIIIAIAALVAGFVLLYTKCEWFRNGVNAVWEGVKAAFNSFMAFITPIWNTFWEGLKIIINAFIAYFKLEWNIMTTVFNAVVSAIKIVWDSFVNALKIAWQGVQIVWNAVCQAFTAIITPIIAGIKALWDGLVAGLNVLWQGLQTAWNTLCQALNSIITPIINAIKALWDTFCQGLNTLWQGLQQAWNTLCNALKSIIDPIINAIKSAWDTFSSGLQVIWNTLQTAWNTLCQALQSIITPIVAAIQALWEGFKGAFDTVCNAVSSAWSTFTGGVTSTWNSVVDGVKSAWEGIKAPFQSVVDSISGIWEGIKSSFKLPHFTFSGSMNPLNWADEGTPSIGVEWYAKGGIMTNPTMFGFNGGNAMVGGEAGAEAILPLDSLFTNVRDIISSEINKLRTDNNNQVVERQPIVLNSTIELDGAEVGRATATYVSEEMAFNTKKGRY